MKEYIESLVCPVHDIHPIADKDWDGFKVTCCCKTFEESCLKEVERLLNK